MKEFLVPVLALLLWQLDPAASSFPKDETEENSPESINVRNRRTAAVPVDCSNLKESSTTYDVLNDVNCQQIYTHGWFTMNMTEEISPSLWNTFSSRVTSSGFVNYHFVNTGIRKVELALETFACKEFILMNNSLLEVVEISISTLIPVKIDKLIIVGNRRLSLVTIRGNQFNGASIEIRDNSALTLIVFDVNTTTVDGRDGLTVERNPRLTTIHSRYPHTFNQIRNMTIRWNGDLDYLTTRRLKMASMVQMHEDSVVQGPGECSFTEEVNHVLDLFGCITVTGDLKISQNFGVPPPGWRLDRVTGNVHLAEHLPEGETERMFDFLKGTLIDGKLSTARCDMPVLHFDLFSSRPIEKPANCKKKKVQQMGGQIQGNSTSLAFIAFFAGSIVMVASLVVVVVLSIMMAIQKRILKRKEEHRTRHFLPPPNFDYVRKLMSDQKKAKKLL